jgi:hypothetical protein
VKCVRPDAAGVSSSRGRASDMSFREGGTIIGSGSVLSELSKADLVALLSMIQLDRFWTNWCEGCRMVRELPSLCFDVLLPFGRRRPAGAGTGAARAAAWRARCR